MQDRQIARNALGSVIPIVVVPFGSDLAIEWGDFKREVDYLREAGAHSLALGFGSEVNTLSVQEIRQVAVAIRDVASELAVVVSAFGVPDSGTSALAPDIDWWMASPPPGESKTVIGYYRQLAALGRPIMVQDAPEQSGVELSADRIAAIAREVPEVLALKIEAPPTARKIRSVREHVRNLPIYGGLHGLWLLEELAAGADGSMPAAGYADLFLRFMRRADETVAAFGPIAWLNRHIGQSFELSLLLQKELLRIRGVFHGRAYTRGSIEGLTPAECERLRAVWAQALALDGEPTWPNAQG